MGANKVAGGLIALIGVILALVPIIVDIGDYFGLIESAMDLFLYWLISFIILIVALIGAILAMAGKKGGAILTMIIGLVMIVVLIIYSLDVWPEIAMYLPCLGSSTWEVYLVDTIGFSFFDTIYVTLESILITVGGIIAIPGED